MAGSVGHLTHTGIGLRLPGLSQSEAKSLDQHYHRVSQAVQDSHLGKGTGGNLGNECMSITMSFNEKKQLLACNYIHDALHSLYCSVIQTGSHLS